MSGVAWTPNTFGSWQLLKAPPLLPHYNELPLCPKCSEEAPPMALIGGSLKNVCSVCGKEASGSDSADPWGMPGHACGVCMAVLCAGCNQELNVSIQSAEAELSLREEFATQNASLEAEVAASAQLLSMTGAEITAAVTSRSEVRAAAVAESAAARVEAARLRAGAATEAATLKKNAADLQADAHRRRSELAEAEESISRATAELRELSEAEAAEAARRAARGEAQDPATLLADLVRERSGLSAKADAAAANSLRQRYLTEEARKSNAGLRSELERLQKAMALAEVTDKCDLADARARLNVLQRSPSPSPRIGSPSPHTSSAYLVAPVPPEAPAPRGLRKFWGDVTGLFQKKELDKKFEGFCSRAEEVFESMADLAEETAIDLPVADDDQWDMGATGSDELGLIDFMGSDASSTSGGTPARAVTPSGSDDCCDGLLSIAERAQLHSELRVSLQDTQVRISEQLSQMNEVHQRLAEVSAELGERNAEALALKADQQKMSVRRAQMRAELASRKLDAKQRRSMLSANVSTALRDYRERARAILETLPMLENREERLRAAEAQLTSIGSALLDDVDDATGPCTLLAGH